MKSKIRKSQRSSSNNCKARPARSRILHLLVPAALATAAPAKAYTVRNDLGGPVDLYAMTAAMTDEPIRILGRCESACTEFLGARQVCVSPNARFMFHAAHNLDGSRNEQGVLVMLASYPPSLREWLYERGGLTARRINATGRDLIALGVPSCR
ncbi:MAG TPA: hypothetical protein VFE63_01365 [Roseiarcus sp.]|jgi:hypothetical protein|nr:hypothetical protein [Roseiarcus sp.]